MALEISSVSGEDPLQGRRLDMRWREVRARLLDPQIASHLGHIVGNSPRGFVAEFGNALNAARCALEMQRDIAAANGKSSDLPPLALRVGIYLGDDLAGGATHANSARNAALLLRAADAGEIVASAEAREQVAGAPDLLCEALDRPGLDEAHGRPVAYRVVPRQAPSRGPRRKTPSLSLAVMPFFGGAGEASDYFIEGVAEDIVRALSSVPELLVVSGASPHARHAAKADPRALGRQLGARYVVTGTTERTSGRLTLAPELVDADSGAVLWRRHYDVPLGAVFELQEEIARRIVRALIPSLGNAELQRIQSKGPENFDAYDLVLQAMSRMYRFELADFSAARALLERAVEVDPDYGVAHTLLAEWHTLNIGQGYCANENAARADLMRAAQSAALRNSGDARTIALLGHCRAWLFRDYEGALDLFEQAFAASPNSAFAWGWSSPTCSYLGDGPSAVAHAEHALRLSPFGPQSYFFYTALGLAHYTSGNYEQAVRWGRRSMAINARYEANLRFLAASLAACGRLRDARTVAGWMLAVRPDFRVNWLSSRYAYKDPARTRALAAHLRLAGLPE